jgi:release factor glutamine methyltransferase
VDRRALIPRPETEQLVEHVVRVCGGTTPVRILDLGTGTGAIALALAHAMPAAGIVAVDRSADALALARENAVTHGCEARISFLVSDWYASVPVEVFDVVVSNPPYLTEAETAETSPEVRGFEPIAALSAADDGLADLTTIIAGASRYLKPGGMLALETGIAHHARLMAQMEAAGFARSESKQDLTGRDRFVLGYAR